MALRPSPRGRLRAPGRGHGREPGHGGGLPGRPRGPPLARPGLGRGPGRRRPPRSLPPVGAAGALPGDERSAPGERTRLPLLVHGRGAGGATEGRAREGGGSRVRRPVPRASRRGGRRVRGRGEAVRDPLPDAGAGVGGAGPGEGRGPVEGRRPQRLRDRALRRVTGVPPRRVRRRHADGHHPRDPRRRPAGERPTERRGDRGARRHTALLRTPSASTRPRREAAVEAPRRHERGRLPGAGVPPGGDGQLPGPPRVGEGRSHDDPRRATNWSRRSTCRMSRTTRRCSTPRSSSG